MNKKFIYSVVVTLLISVCSAEEKDHEMCCNSCASKYKTLDAGTINPLETACTTGCRLYAMIYLANGRDIRPREVSAMCSRSCAGSAACAAGCASQAGVFRRAGVTGGLTAKLAVANGLATAPVVASPAPYHARMFARLPPSQPQEARQRPRWWLRAVRVRVSELPAGPDGRPRYWVEISETVVPLGSVAAAAAAAAAADASYNAAAASELQPRALVFFASRWQPGHRLGLASSVLLATLGVCLMWLGCWCVCVASAAPGAGRMRTRVISRRPVLLLPAAVGKKVPLSVQSGDIVVSASAAVLPEKKPLAEV